MCNACGGYGVVWYDDRKVSGFEGLPAHPSVDLQLLIEWYPARRYMKVMNPASEQVEVKVVTRSMAIQSE